jgi:hypothetical protein
MKKSIKVLALMFFAVVIVGCTKTDSTGIEYNLINKNLVLIRDVETLKNSSDEISLYVDSILTGLIDAQFISTGHRKFDLSENAVPDIAFEIIDLNLFNPQGLPEHFDSLAARVIPINIEILDNSTYGYPDALNPNEVISGKGNWMNNTGVLGTFGNAGQFKGQGDKYLGIRFPADDDYRYGWIRLTCSEHNDTLKIIDYAFNNKKNSSIKAGQKE